MTNEEAIENIKLIRFNAAITNANSFKEALDMAIEALSKPELPSNLDEAAEDSWAVYEYRESPRGLYSTCYVDGFKAGAEWMAGQGVSYDCRCVEAFQRAVGGVMNAQFPFKDLGLKDGDEVIIQIRKK